MENQFFSRRVAIKSSLFGILSVSLPNVLFARNIFPDQYATDFPKDITARYPAIEEAVVSEVVGFSHFNLDGLKKLVDARPELSRATWDWGFADWESAIGAAAHVGRKDIVEYLLSKGARPDIFTFAMLGAYGTVKSMIDFSPGIQRIAGPHGISLLQHAKNGLETNKSAEGEKLVSYLESLGDADGIKYPTIEESAKAKYLGDYRYGEKEGEGFTVKLNMRKLLSLGKLGKNGGALYYIGENQFIYNGAPSVKISFAVENNIVRSLTITEPGLSLTAKKV